MPVQVPLRHLENLVARPQQVEIDRAGPRIEVGEFFRRGEQALITRQIFNHQEWHGRGGAERSKVPNHFKLSAAFFAQPVGNVIFGRPGQEVSATNPFGLTKPEQGSGTTNESGTAEPQPKQRN